MPKGEFCTRSSPSCLERRCVRKLGQALGAPGVEHAQLVCFHLRANPVESAAAMICPPRMDCIRSALPFVGHVQQFQAQLLGASSMVRCGLVMVPVEP